MLHFERIVFASANAGKAREIKALLGDATEVVLQTELGIESIEETGKTFADNALLKARHAAECSGLPALADDSGLEVDALDGAPGVYSARYAGEDASDQDNLEKLLDAMLEVSDEHRAARFTCVLALVRDVDDPDPLFASGHWEGSITREARGEGGFGYDPVFLDPESGLTSAELAPADKNARSHRGRALVELRELLGRE